MGFWRGYRVFFIARLIPVLVNPVRGFSPGDGRHYGRRERDGKIVGAGRSWGFGFLERRKSGRSRRGSGRSRAGNLKNWKSGRRGSRNRSWGGEGGGIIRLGEESLDGSVLVLEIKFHVCGGKGEYEGVEEVSYG